MQTNSKMISTNLMECCLIKQKGMVNAHSFLSTLIPIYLFLKTNLLSNMSSTIS